MDGTPVGLRVVGPGVGGLDGLAVVGVCVGFVLIGDPAVVIMTKVMKMILMRKNEMMTIHSPKQIQ